MKSHQEKEIASHVDSFPQRGELATGGPERATPHSALPWFVGDRNGNDESAACSVENDEWCLADVWSDVEELTPAIARANAEFICRAVNNHEAMLAALKLAANVMETFEVGVDQEIRRAIAKAEGR